MTDTDKLKLSQNMALIAGIFCVVVAMLLVLNFIQIKKSNPIESETLKALVERLKQEPNNEQLKTEIRSFDLLARKAYFNSQWQVKTGTYLLLFGAVILAISLRVYYTAKSKIDTPDISMSNEIASRILAQKGIIIIGSALIILALGASYLTVNHLKYYDVSEKKKVAEPTDETIKVIQVAENPHEIGLTNDTLKVDSSKAGTVNSVVTTPTDSLKADSAVMDKTPVSLSDIQRYHNSFRGPLGQGVVFHKNLPVQWDGTTGTNILWKSALPKRGFNSPVVWGDKIFLSGADNSGREVYCISRSNGKILWTGKADNIQGSPASPPKATEDTGLAAPTVTTDGKRVYAIFGTGDIISFDFKGNRVWARNLGVPDNHYGHSSSLITWNNKVFVQFDTNKGGKIMALDAFTGNTVWETSRNSKISWASPVLANINGKYQVILTADPIVAGYDTESGKEIWSVECMMGEVGPSVAFSKGTVFAANEYAKLVAINPNSKSIIWEADEYLPEASSPVAKDGLLIIATSYGVLACYDATSGSKLWEHDCGKTIYSSPIIADGKIYLTDNEGTMRVYEFGKELKLLSENPLGEKSGPTPAFANGRIYIRGVKNLYCIGN